MDKLRKLLEKGVVIHNPDTVHVDQDVDTDRISGDGVVLYPGCRIKGEKTLVLAGSKIGAEAPVTLDDCYVGPDVQLKGGFFQKAVFAGNNSFGSGAHAREGTILEEEASAAHTVGLKQTLLFPFVTLGSLINFCDCFMAGGTDRKNHSEVGSSFIHFNYTPNQDKATPSMIGNVHQGVLLDRNPIFLGGQGGIVGPCRIAFGCITAAGSIIRKDEPNQDRLLLGGSFKDASIKKPSMVYKNVKRVFNHNCSYIAALCALLGWYTNIRILFARSRLEKELHSGMVETLKGCITERIKRVEGFVENLEVSRNLITDKAEKDSHRTMEHHEAILNTFEDKKEIMQKAKTGSFSGTISIKDLEPIRFAAQNGKSYLETIKGLEGPVKERISSRLYSVETEIFEKIGI
ncbi:MAG: protein GlmU [Desulfobacteraceae bacterium]